MILQLQDADGGRAELDSMQQVEEQPQGLRHNAAKHIPMAHHGHRLADFDLVLSYTGGAALTELKRRLGPRRTIALYGSVDPGVHFPVAPVDRFRVDLSYLGTYVEDRQHALLELFIPYCCAG